MGFVGPNCEFLSISSKLCSSSHDATQYIVSDFSMRLRAGDLPRWAHIVLDEAYPNKQQELSPFRGKNLSTEQDSFNYYLSVHRQVVERAFGLLVARWGVFWRPLQIKFSHIPLLVCVCCKLHNVCVERFGAITTKIDIARGDCQPGDNHEPLYTDGTGMYAGRRTDLEHTTSRNCLMQRLKQMGKVRPTHSIMHRRRICA